MTQPTCSIDGCGRKIAGRGFCASHLRRFREYGNAEAGPPIRGYSPPLPRSATLEDRFWAKVNIPADVLGCWEWTGALNPGNGYAVIQAAPGRRRFAHQVSYELSMGTIGTGMEIDHVCRNRKCVNPLHLRAVSASDNSRARPDRKVTHCPKGHPYSGDNLYEHKGHRHCRACQAERRNAA